MLLAYKLFDESFVTVARRLQKQCKNAPVKKIPQSTFKCPDLLTFCIEIVLKIKVKRYQGSSNFFIITFYLNSPKS